MRSGRAGIGSVRCISWRPQPVPTFLDARVGWSFGEAVRLCASFEAPTPKCSTTTTTTLTLPPRPFTPLSLATTGIPLLYPSPAAPLDCAVLFTLNDRLASTNNSTGRLALRTCAIAAVVSRQQTITHHHLHDSPHITQLAIAIPLVQSILLASQISTVMQ
jgi:hypothetical protein